MEFFNKLRKTNHTDVKHPQLRSLIFIFACEKKNNLAKRMIEEGDLGLLNDLDLALCKLFGYVNFGTVLLHAIFTSCESENLHNLKLLFDIHRTFCIRYIKKNLQLITCLANEETIIWISQNIKFKAYPLNYLHIDIDKIKKYLLPSLKHDKNIPYLMYFSSGSYNYKWPIKADTLLYFIKNFNMPHRIINYIMAVFFNQNNYEEIKKLIDYYGDFLNIGNIINIFRNDNLDIFKLLYYNNKKVTISNYLDYMKIKIGSHNINLYNNINILYWLYDKHKNKIDKIYPNINLDHYYAFKNGIKSMLPNIDFLYSNQLIMLIKYDYLDIIKYLYKSNCELFVNSAVLRELYKKRKIFYWFLKKDLINSINSLKILQDSLLINLKAAEVYMRFSNNKNNLIGKLLRTNSFYQNVGNKNTRKFILKYGKDYLGKNISKLFNAAFTYNCIILLDWIYRNYKIEDYLKTRNNDIYFSPNYLFGTNLKEWLTNTKLIHYTKLIKVFSLKEDNNIKPFTSSKETYQLGDLYFQTHECYIKKYNDKYIFKPSSYSKKESKICIAGPVKHKLDEIRQIKNHIKFKNNSLIHKYLIIKYDKKKESDIIEKFFGCSTSEYINN